MPAKTTSLLTDLERIVREGTLDELGRRIEQGLTQPALRQGLRWAVEQNDADMMRALISGGSGSLVTHTLLMQAVKHDAHKVIPLLMAHTDAKAQSSTALLQAVKQKHWATALALVPFSDVNTDRGNTLANVIQGNGGDALVQAMISHGASSLSLNNGWHRALIWNKVSSVRLLMDHVDPANGRSNALYKAISFEFMDLARLLVERSDPEMVYADKMKPPSKNPDWQPPWGEIDTLATVVSTELRQRWMADHPGKLVQAEAMQRAAARAEAAGPLEELAPRRRRSLT